MNYKSKDYKILRELFLESQFEDYNFEYSENLEGIIENLINKKIWRIS